MFILDLSVRVMFDVKEKVNSISFLLDKAKKKL